MKMIKWGILVLVLFLTNAVAFPQQLKLGKNPFAVEKSAVLELQSDNQGLLFPRINDTSLMTAMNPPDGMVIFQISSLQLLLRSGGSWKPLTVSASLNNFWSLTGNSIDPASNFLGTTNLSSLRMRTNGVQGMMLDSVGNVGIGNDPLFTPGINREKLLVDAGSTISNPSTTFNVISGKGYIDNYLQLNIQNKSPGTSASSDLVASNDLGSETTNFIDMGINSSAYNFNGLPILNGANNAYIYSTGNDFLLGNATLLKHLRFFTGGTALTNERMRIDSLGNVGIGTGAAIVQNRLEIVKLPAAAASVSGLRLQGLGTATPVTALTKVLSVNPAGDVIVTNYPAAISAWLLGGNSISATNYIGSTNAQPLVFKANGIERMRLLATATAATGGLAIGATALDVNNPEKLLVESGTSAAPSTSFNVISGKGFINNYLQLNIQNRSNGGVASSDVVASNDAGTETANFIDMGINSSGNTTTGVLGGLNTAYLYATGSDFVIGNATTGKPLRFYTTDGVGSTERMRIGDNGNVGIGNLTPTEILDVTGNVRFSGALMPNNDAGVAGTFLTSAGLGAPPTWSVFDTTSIAAFSTKVRSLFQATGPITYSNGRIGITQSSASTDGYLSSADWNAFNNKSTTSGTVTGFSAIGTQGVSTSVANPTTTPELTIGLGDITPNSVVATGTVTGSNLSGTNTGNQTISLTGDVTGSGMGSFAATIGTNKVTYDKFQQVAASKLLGNPAASGANASEITLGNGFSFVGSTLNYTPATSGTVSSVGLILPDIFNVTVSPITSSGSLTAELSTQTANRIFAGPITGSASAPAFRALAPADLPLATASTVGGVSAGSGLTVSGTGVLSTNFNLASLSATAPLVYNNLSGQLSIPAASGSSNGYLTSTNWTTFNNKVSGISITGSPVFGSSNISVAAGGAATGTLNLSTQAKNTFFSGPVTGINAEPTFRTLAPADLPVATLTTLGAISVGAGLAVSPLGVLSATNTNGGTVTSFSATGTQGVSALVTNPSSTPALTIGLGDITPNSVAATGTVTGSNLSGTNTGNQTIELTGDVTGSGTGSFDATIGTNKVTYGKFQQVAASRLLGNPTGTTANASEITLGSGFSFVGSVLNYNSAVSGWSLSGNSIDPANNFLGTTNLTSLRMRTNGVQGMMLDSLGNVGVGTAPLFTASPNREKFIVDAGLLDQTTGSFNLITATGEKNGYLQLNIKNRSNGTLASSDVVASNNLGDETINYIDMGINSTGNNTTGVLGGASTAYLYSTGNDFVIGNNTNAKPIRFYTTTGSVSTERMRIDDLGRVGIGNTAPAEKLDIVGNLKLTGGAFMVGSTGAGTNGTFLQSTGAGTAPQWVNPQVAIDAISWSLVGNAGTNWNTNFLGTKDNNSLRIRTNNAQRMWIDSIGSVAIGAAPVFTPGVNRERLLVDAGNTTSYNVMSGKGSIDSYLQLNIQNRNSGAAASSDVVASANNGDEATNYIDMGINSSGYANTGILGGMNNAYLYSTGNDFIIGNATATKPLRFFTGGYNDNNERMRIDGTGNIGIGTTTPSSRLHVFGTNPLTLTGVQTGTNTAADSLLTITDGLVRKIPFSSFTAGTVTSFSATGEQGVVAIVTNPTTTPSLTIGLDNIMPTSVFASGTVTGSNLSGTNTGDQTISLTGDVTGSGKGSFDATIGANKVTYNKFQQVGSAKLLGNPTGLAANASEIALGTGFSFTGSTLNYNSAATGWSLSGNSIDPAANFLGTTNLASLRMRTNGVQGMFLDSIGNVGIGTDPTFSADLAREKLLVDAGATTSFNLISGKGSIDNYLQLNIQNKSAGTSASADIVASNNLGSETANFIDMGINSSTYNYNGIPILNGVSNAYLYSTGNDFILGNASANKSLRFFTGGTATGNERMRIESNGNTGIGITNPANTLVVKDVMEIRRTTGVSQLLFSGTANSGDFRIAGDGGDIFWQGGGSRVMQMGSFWGLILASDRQTTTIPAFQNGVPNTNTSVLIPAQRDVSVPLAIQGFSATHSANLTEWRTYTGERMNVVDKSGNFGIGTALPTAKLHVSGTNPLTLWGVQAGSSTTADSLLTITSGVVRKVPFSALTTGTVTTFSATGTQGVTALVTNPSSTPALTIGLVDITPNSVAATGTVTGSNLSGTNTGNQTIELTGDVTGSGTGSFDATIGTNKVTYGKFQQVAASTLLGNPTGALANASEITLGSGFSFTGSVLNYNSAASGWSLSGNSIDPANNFLGTTNLTSLRMRTNGVQGMMLDSLGNVGVGASPFFTPAPNREKFIVDAGTLDAAGSFNLITATGDKDGYLQLNIKNRSAGIAASSDVVASNNQGDESINYIDMGINSTGNTSTGILGGSNTAYLYSTGNDFVIGNSANNKPIRFYTTILNTPTERMRLDSAGRVGIGVSPTAFLHLKAGVAAAGNAPLKFVAGTLLTTPEPGAMEFAGDRFYGTISGNFRKEFVLNDGTALTTGRVPYTTTNGRLTDNASMTYSSTRLSPTYITLAPGAAAAGKAPLVMTAGINLTTPLAGAIEFDGTHFYGTIGTTRYTLDQQAGSVYTGSNGITLVGNDIRNNLITGVSTNQTVTGGLSAANTLTLTSTANAAKGKILFGTSAYDEANNRLGIGNSIPAQALDVTGNLQFSGALMPAGLAGTAGSFLTSAGAGIAPTWTALSGTAPISYSNGVIGITQASASTDGYLSSADWNTFNNKPSATTGWSTLGNSGLNGSTNFLGTLDDVAMVLKSNSQPYLEFGRRQTLGLVQSYPDYTDANQKVTHVRSALQFEAPAASFYKPMMYTDVNGNFRVKGSSAGTDLFEFGSTGTNNNGGFEFIIGDDGDEPILFKSFHHANGMSEIMRLQSGRMAVGSNSFNATNPEKLLIDAGVTTSYNLMTGKGSIDNYLQINVQNSSNGVNASSDLVATSNNGDEGSNFIDMGINSGGNLSTSYPILSGANTAYLYSAGNDLIIGNATLSKPIRFFTGGTSVANERMQIDGIGNIGMGITSPATKLHVFGTNPLTLTGVQPGTSTSADSLLTITNGLVRKVPFTTVTDGGWSLSGNSIDPATSFLGTTNLTSLRMRTNGVQGMMLDSLGSVSIGAAPVFTAVPNREKFLVDAGLLDPTGSFNLISAIGEKNGYLQLNVKNRSALAGASSDVVASNNQGDETNNFIDMGINSTGYAAGGVLGGGSTAYLYSTGNDFVIGNNTTGKPLRFYTTAVGTSAERMRVDSAGRVGIGNIAPTERLDITGNIKFSGAFMPNNSPGLAGTFLQSAGANQPPQWLDPSVALNAISWALDGNAGVTWNNHFLGTRNAQPLRIRTNNVQRMWIDSVGSVAIGTSPTFALGLNREKFLVDAGPTLSFNLINAKGSIDNYLQLNIQNQSNGPSASSDVVATADNGTESTNYIDMGINSSGNSSGFFGGINDAYLYNIGEDLLIGTATAGKSLRFLTGGGSEASNERMTVSSTGNVGINNASPGQRLDVNGSINAQGSVFVDGGVTNTGIAKPGLVLGGASSGETISSKRSGGTNQYGIDFYTASNPRMTINNAGNVGIGTTTPNSTLTVAGSVAMQYRSVAGGSTTISATDYAVINTGATGTWTLPAANTCPGRNYVLVNQGTAVLTISPGIKTDNSSPPLTSTILATAGSNSVQLLSDGTNWIKIN